MEKNGKNMRDVIDVLGGYLQRSTFVSLLMILMVFATCVFLLWWMPNQSDLPQLSEGDVAQQDIEVVLDDFRYPDIDEQERVADKINRESPLFFQVDSERTKQIIVGYELLVKEILRRNAAETDGKNYEAPDNADEETARRVVFVRELPPYLYYVLLQTYLDNARKTKAAAQVEEIVIGGIATGKELEKASEDYELAGNAVRQDTAVKQTAPGNGDQAQEIMIPLVYDQRNVMILDSESREIPGKMNEIQTPESAAELTVNSLLSAVSYGQRVILENDYLKNFFMELYKDGNLVYNRELTDQRRDNERKTEIGKISKLKHPKGMILIHKDRKLTKREADLYREYRIQYSGYLRKQRTWSSLFQKTLLVALLVVFSCICILRVHPELVSNNRAIWLIGFIVIFSLLCDYGFMVFCNGLMLDGKCPQIPLYLVMPLALPALVIASIYGGRSAVFAGLFVAGGAAVALDLSFPAFATGLFVCAVSTAAVRRVYDYKEFFTQAFFACAATMILSAVIFQQNPDFQTMVKSHDFSRLVACMVVPLTAGLVTAMLALVLIIALETLLDVTSNMSYLSLTDRNHPLLKKLQMDAPGTYHHSERVALLAEEAANAVGAMSQKVQAYALFHDVGKLVAPEMFTENAGGKDMFKGKTPLESAAVVRSHVEYGVQLAKKYKLKTPLRRAIERHHGNDFISFFYEKEKERTGTTPPEEPFRYPGPLPEEVETVILMMADCCEAAVCSLDEPTEESIRVLVEKIFNGKMQRKQLDGAHITLDQLTRIRESFLKTFKSMNHLRVSYSRREEKHA